MSTDIRQSLLQACRALLRPVALILLRGGVTWREFSALSKSVFVSVATDEFGIRGRPTNVSRVSILTGISRKEIKRQRELLSETDEVVAASKSSDATRVLSGWFQDERFQTADGLPAALPALAEDDSASFEELFQRYGGDTPKQTLLRELIEAGSIARKDNDHYIALRRYHMPIAMDEGNVRFFGTNLFDHANTLCNNLTDPESPKRLEGFAVETEVDERYAEDFRRFIDVRGQQILEEIDDWLAQHRAEPGSKSSTCRLGIGLYGIEGDLPGGTPS